MHARLGESGNAKNPAFYLRDFPVASFEARIEIIYEGSVSVGLAHPCGDRIRVVLMGITALSREVIAPE